MRTDYTLVSCCSGKKWSMTPCFRKWCAERSVAGPYVSSARRDESSQGAPCICLSTTKLNGLFNFSPDVLYRTKSATCISGYVFKNGGDCFCLNFEHLLNKKPPFKNLKMTVFFFLKGGILNISLSTHCVVRHSRSAKVKFDLCTCGVGREEGEEPPVGHRGVLLGTAREGLLHPHVHPTRSRDKQGRLSENWCPLQTHGVCSCLSGGARSKARETLAPVRAILPFPSQPSSFGKGGNCPGQTQARAHGRLSFSPSQNGPASCKAAGVLSSYSH